MSNGCTNRIDLANSQFSRNGANLKTQDIKQRVRECIPQNKTQLMSTIDDAVQIGPTQFVIGELDCNENNKFTFVEESNACLSGS